jgi:hypothetical protein
MKILKMKQTSLIDEKKETKISIINKWKIRRKKQSPSTNKKKETTIIKAIRWKGDDHHHGQDIF